MSKGITPEDYLQLREFLSHACGIDLGDNKQYLVDSRLRGVVEKNGYKTIGDLVAAARRDAGSAISRSIIESMTTHETLWFRDQYPFEALKRMIFPELARRNIPVIRIWSAACSSGQEPYSICMVLEEYRNEYPRHPLGSVRIVATDVSSTILKGAQNGIYEHGALSRGLTLDRREKYFEKMAGKERIKDFIRNQVTFQELNLIGSFAGLGKFHVIFCRNVLIYFSDEQKSNILDRLAQAIEPGGYLFLGGTEAISRYTNKFEVARCYGGMVFQLK